MEKLVEVMENKIMVSVIVPVYNVNRFLGECLDSIIGQTYNRLEIILVDDGSTDGSSEICDAYAQKDDRIVVIHKKNGGLSDARNTGLDVSHGDYYFFSDSDDIVEKDAIETLVKLAEKEDADMVIGGCVIVNEDGSFRKNTGETFIEGEISETQFWDYAGKYTAATLAQSKLYKKHIWEDGIRFPKGLIHEDHYVLPRVINKCKKIVCTNKVIFKYRQVDNSIMHKEFRFKRLDFIESTIGILNYIKGKGVEETERIYVQQGMRILGKGKACLKMSSEEKHIFADKYVRFKDASNHVKFHSAKERLQVFMFRNCLGLYAFLHNLRDNEA